MCMFNLTVVDAKSRERYAWAREFHNIGQVKFVVDQQTGIPYHRQLLFYQESLLRDDNAFLAHYFIPCLAEIVVYEKFSSQLIGIDVSWKGRHHVYELSSDDTVMTLKKMFEEEVGIPVHQQRMTAFGAVMENDDKLEEFAIEWSDVNQVYLIAP